MPQKLPASTPMALLSERRFSTQDLSFKPQKWFINRKHLEK